MSHGTTFGKKKSISKVPKQGAMVAVEAVHNLCMDIDIVIETGSVWLTHHFICLVDSLQQMLLSTCEMKTLLLLNLHDPIPVLMNLVKNKLDSVSRLTEWIKTQVSTTLQMVLSMILMAHHCKLGVSKYHTG
eukprot:12128348-Ditylum_brightwellii.AAC.1